MVKYDLKGLKLVFGGMLPRIDQDKELASYRFRDTRPDGIELSFNFCGVERWVSFFITCANGVCAAAISVSDFQEVRVVDTAPGHRVIEILWGDEKSQPRKIILELDGTRVLKLNA